MGTAMQTLHHVKLRIKASGVLVEAIGSHEPLVIYTGKESLLAKYRSFFGERSNIMTKAPVEDGSDESHFSSTEELVQYLDNIRSGATIFDSEAEFNMTFPPPPCKLVGWTGGPEGCRIYTFSVELCDFIGDAQARTVHAPLASHDKPLGATRFQATATVMVSDLTNTLSMGPSALSGGSHVHSAYRGGGATQDMDYLLVALGVEVGGVSSSDLQSAGSVITEAKSRLVNRAFERYVPPMGDGRGPARIKDYNPSETRGKGSVNSSKPGRFRQLSNKDREYAGLFDTIMVACSGMAQKEMLMSGSSYPHELAKKYGVHQTHYKKKVLPKLAADDKERRKLIPDRVTGPKMLLRDMRNKPAEMYSSATRKEIEPAKLASKIAAAKVRIAAWEERWLAALQRAHEVMVKYRYEYDPLLEGELKAALEEYEEDGEELRIHLQVGLADSFYRAIQVLESAGVKVDEDTKRHYPKWSTEDQEGRQQQEGHRERQEWRQELRQELRQEQDGRRERREREQQQQEERRDRQGRAGGGGGLGRIAEVEEDLDEEEEAVGKGTGGVLGDRQTPLPEISESGSSQDGGKDQKRPNSKNASVSKVKRVKGAVGGGSRGGKENARGKSDHGSKRRRR
ncbi:hypothetical protein Agub_g10575 [Astrephomene gubernaculifera]|uniref:Uncharacterized protein n=2 Tax=Astrephomene gubernaculifera TaxID=47775 RepID=A0AAD3HQ63_9CHLO|nr:hypothetical protein Agub_g10575 [Astrephomene gubernaculifera]